MKKRNIFITILVRCGVCTIILLVVTTTTSNNCISKRSDQHSSSPLLVMYPISYHTIFSHHHHRHHRHSIPISLIRNLLLRSSASLAVVPSVVISSLIFPSIVSQLSSAQHADDVLSCSVLFYSVQESIVHCAARNCHSSRKMEFRMHTCTLSSSCDRSKKKFQVLLSCSSGVAWRGVARELAVLVVLAVLAVSPCCPPHKTQSTSKSTVCGTNSDFLFFSFLLSGRHNLVFLRLEQRLEHTWWTVEWSVMGCDWGWGWLDSGTRWNGMDYGDGEKGKERPESSPWNPSFEVQTLGSWGLGWVGCAVLCYAFAIDGFEFCMYVW